MIRRLPTLMMKISLCTAYHYSILSTATPTRKVLHEFLACLHTSCCRCPMVSLAATIPHYFHDQYYLYFQTSHLCLHLDLIYNMELLCTFPMRMIPKGGHSMCHLSILKSCARNVMTPILPCGRRRVTGLTA